MNNHINELINLAEKHKQLGEHYKFIPRVFAEVNGESVERFEFQVLTETGQGVRRAGAIINSLDLEYNEGIIVSTFKAIRGLGSL